MNILLISSDNNKTSGAFLCLVELAERLQRVKKHRVVVVLSKSGDGQLLLDERDIRYILVPMLSWVVFKNISFTSIGKYFIKCMGLIFNIYALIILCWIIYNYKIDIIHNNTIFTYVGALAAHIMNKPIVWHIRENLSEAFYSKIIFQNWGYKLINSSDQVIFTSKNLQDKYIGICHSKSRVIYDGISLKFYNNHSILLNPIVKIAIIGHLNTNKNQKLLIEVLGDLYKKGVTNFETSIIGDGELINELKVLVSKLDLEKHVIFKGRRKEIDKILLSTDILVSTSISEAFGRTLAEGMLSGCLVISANGDYNAADELIDDKSTGLLFEINDKSKLTEILYTILTSLDHSIYQQIALRGQRKSHAKFTEDISFKNLIDVYESILKGRTT